jgi:hypothetical protein
MAFLFGLLMTHVGCTSTAESTGDAGAGARNATGVGGGGTGGGGAAMSGGGSQGQEIRWQELNCAGPATTPPADNRCTPTMMCIEACGDHDCVQGCLNGVTVEGTDPAEQTVCQEILALAQCEFEQSQPGGPCENCFGTTTCVCTGDCSNVDLAGGCYSCLVQACNIGNCITGECI